MEREWEPQEDRTDEAEAAGIADEYEPCYADGSVKNECWKSE